MTKPTSRKVTSKVIRVDEEVYKELKRRKVGLSFSDIIRNVLKEVPEICPCGSAQPLGHQCWS